MPVPWQHALWLHVIARLAPEWAPLAHTRSPCSRTKARNGTMTARTSARSVRIRSATVESQAPPGTGMVHILSTYCRRDIKASRIGANVLNVLRMLSAISKSATSRSATCHAWLGVEEPPTSISYCITHSRSRLRIIHESACSG